MSDRGMFVEVAGCTLSCPFSFAVNRGGGSLQGTESVIVQSDVLPFRKFQLLQASANGATKLEMMSFSSEVALWSTS